MSETGIKVQDVYKTFGELDVLRGVNLQAEPGQFLVVVGESGGGKSTLLRIMAGVEKPDGGEVHIDHPVGVVFQDSRLIPWKQVWQNVSFGLPSHQSKNRTLAVQALKEVGLAEWADVWPRTLSGGQAQRVALARALVKKPKLLLLDEPLGALDALTRLQMHALLRKLWKEHQFTALQITHDVDEAISLGDRIVVLADGQIIDSIELDFPGPRKHSAPGFDAVRKRLLRQLNVSEEAF